MAQIKQRKYKTFPKVGKREEISLNWQGAQIDPKTGKKANTSSQNKQELKIARKIGKKAL